MTDGGRDDSLQNPLVHEGAKPDGRDSNEKADDKATIAAPEEETASE